MDNALIAILALLANLVLGGPRALYAASGMSRIGRIPGKLLRDREADYHQDGRQVLLVSYVICAALLLGVILNLVLRNNLNFLEVVLVACLLPVRPLIDRLLEMKQALAAHDVVQARKALEGTVWKHHVLLDAHGVARAGVELMAVQFSEKLVTPLLWYLLFGLPGLMICKAIVLMRETLPATYAVDANVGKMLLRAPSAFSWIGARLASVLWIAAALLLPGPNIRQLLSKFGNPITRLPALPYAVFSVATVLGLSLAGPTSAYYNAGWLGDGNARPEAAEIGRALWLLALVLLFLFLLLALFL
jgi:adenosylcobinamide-phosphate synthase